MAYVVALAMLSSLVCFIEQLHGFNFLQPAALPQNLQTRKPNTDTDQKISNMKKTFEEKVSDLKEELSLTTARLEKQCLLVDQMNTVIQGSAEFDGYPLLTFEDADISSLFPGIQNKISPATSAIDGRLSSTNMGDGSCTHTAADPTPWWLGVLAQESEIYRIELRDRTDCCIGRLNHIMVQVFETDPRQNTDAVPKLCKAIPHTNDAIVNVTCDKPLTGKYIRVLKNRKQVFHLCEVRAFGYVDESRKFGKASQSSQVAEAHLATDGDPNTCSETQNEAKSSPWWQVDLLEETTLTGLTITNRGDKNYTFLSNFEVSVSQTFPSVCVDSTQDVCTSHEGTVGQGKTVTLTCGKPMTGRYLRITKLNGGTLSLCDVRVEKEERANRLA